MVPLVAAAVCPHPPLIVPELAGAAAPELADLRAACAAAVTALYAVGARTVVLVGSGERTAELEPPYRGSFTPWGLSRTVRLGPGPTDPEPAPDGPVPGAHGSGSVPDLGAPVLGLHGPASVPGLHGPGSAPGLREPAPGLREGAGELPLSLLVGAWLVDRVTPPTPTAWRMVSVAPDEPVDRCAAVGAGLVGAGRVPDGPWALLVLGDGSACHGPKAPGYADPRAGAYDEGVARALAGADVDALLGLDPVVSAELKVAGRAAWQVLAGAVRAAGGDWHGELRHHSNPYGVGYLVASWTRTAGRVR
ncbi:class III extradiol dioxygenase subunit B-like domain-containing protein [Micromonospora rifamycinica]